MQHPVAGEEVVRARVGVGGVWSDANVAAVELGRDDTLDGEVGEGQLLSHRLVEAGK